MARGLKRLLRAAGKMTVFYYVGNVEAVCNVMSSTETKGKILHPNVAHKEWCVLDTCGAGQVVSKERRARVCGGGGGERITFYC